MQIVEAIQENPLVARNGAESLECTQSNLDAVLHTAHELNLAVWELVFQSKDQFFDNLEEVLKPHGETWSALADVRDAWTELADSTEDLQQDLLRPTSS